MKTSSRPPRPRSASPHPPADSAPLPHRLVYDRERLVALRDALAVEQPDLNEGVPEAVAAILRIVQALRQAARAHHIDGVEAAATALEAAATESAEALKARLDDLLQTLDAVIDETNGPKARILVIEPDPDTAAMLEVILAAPNREVFVAGTAQEAERRLARDVFSLIVLELVLPDLDGRNLLVRLRAHAGTALTPVFVLSSFGRPQVKTECFALGADAFFEVPFDPADLAAAVTVHLQRRTRHDSTDPLTGLPDRTAMEEAFDRARAFYDLTETPFCIALLDFDDFKAVNRIYGPPMGDEVLRRSASLIAQTLREFDLLGRWQGDRFCTLFPNTTVDEAARIMDLASQAVHYEAFQAQNGQTFHVSFSTGIVTLKPTDTDLEGAVAKAERCIRKAKEGGARGRVLTEAHIVEPEPPSILVVEDDEDIAAIIAFRLEREGYRVIPFEDGKQAVAFAENHRADLVILDVKVPGMDGFEILSRLRKMPAYAHTPVIMLTSMGRERDVVRGFELGADDYILKPFSPVELSARVRRLTRARRAPAVAPHA